MNRHDRRAHAAAERRKPPGRPSGSAGPRHRTTTSTGWTVFWLTYAALIAAWFIIGLA